MAGGGGQYTIRVHGVLDESQIRAQLDALSKDYGFFGGKAGKGAGAYMASAGKGAKKGAQGMSAYIKGTEKAVKTNKRFGQSTIDITKKVIQFGATTAVIRGVTSGMADMVNKTFELDSALTEYKKVSDLSGKSLEKYTDQAFKAGRQTARTGTEMIEAATQFKKMGYDDQMSMQLATTASMFQNIADVEIDAGQAALFINSQLKAFRPELSKLGDEGTQAMRVIDGVNEVANNFGVGTNDLQLALSKTSSAMGGFGNSFSETIGIITAGTEVMVGQPSKVARGWRTIGANIAKVAKEADTYSAASGKVNIAMRNQNGEMKSTYEFLTDLHKEWGNLNDEEKQAIGIELAGKNHLEVFRATMDNFTTAIEANETAQKSQGSAARENARALESLQGHLQELKSAWSEFSNSMVKSEGLKKAMDMLSSFLRFLSTDAGHAFLGLAAGATAAHFALKPLLKLLSLGGGAGQAIKGFNVFAGAFGKTEKKLKAGSKTFKGTAKRFDGMSKTFIVQGKKSEKSATSLGKTLAKAFGGGAEGLGLLGAGGLVAGIGLLSVALAKFVPIGEEANKKVFDKKYDKSLSQLEELRDKYKGIKDEIAQLEEKRKSDEGLTAGEEHRLELLKEEEEALKRQIELQKQRNAEDFERKERTPDLSNLGGSKLFQKTRGGTGMTNEQVAKQLGIYDQLTAKVAEFRNATMEAGDAQKQFAQGKISLDDLNKAQDGVAESMQAVKDKQKEWLDQYGSVDKMPKAMQKSYKAVEEVTDAYDRLSKKANKGVDFGDLSDKKVTKLVDDFKTLGQNIGLSVDAAGNINNVDFNQFDAGLKSAGFTTEQVRDSLAQITKENPKATVTIEGTQVAAKDVDTVLDYLDKVAENDPEATIEINGTEVAVSDIQGVDDLIQRINGTDIETTFEEHGADGILEKFTEVQKGAKVLDAFKPIIDLIWNGDEAEEGVEKTEDSLDDLNGTTATATMKVDGSEDAAHQTGIVASALASIAGKVAQAIVGVVGADVGAAAVSLLMGVIGALTGKTVPVNEAGASPSAGRVQGLIKTIGSLVGKTVTAKANTVGAGAVASLKGMIAGLHSKTVSIVTKVKKIFSAKGTRHAEGGLAEVNENGFEYIRDAKTGMLRVANGGKRGTTLLGEGDTVYTHGQSLRMKQEQEEELPHFKKGKKGKSVSRKTYNKAIKKIRDKYEKELEKLEYKADVKHWTDEKLVSEKQKLYDKYTKKIKKYNQTHTIKAKKKKDRKKKTTLGTSNKRDLGRAVAELEHDTAVAEIESRIEDYLGTEKNLQAALAKIDAALKAQQISADEAAELRKKAYKANVDYYMRLLEKGEMTYKQLAEIVQKYYNDGMLTEVEYYEYLEDAAEEYKSQMIDKMEDVIDAFYDTVDKYGNIIGSSFEGALDELRRLAAEGQLTAEEALKYERELYQKHLDSMFNAYRYDKKTYRDMKDMVNDYYNAGKLSAEDYYDYLQDLADEAMDKEKERLEKQKDLNDNTYDLARSYVEFQIDKLEKQNEELEEQNELIELQNDLEKAKSRRIRIYREGVGFVYEQDREAIEEANKALTDYQKQQESPELKAWKEVLELFDQQEVLANIKDLENRVGHTVAELFGSMGTNTAVWTAWIKDSLAESMGLNALLESMDEIEYWDDVIGYLNGSGQVDSNIVQDWINRSRYASGSLYTPAGFARVDEQGYEIGVFGKGDAVIPHNLSRNLMQWGAMTPLEYAEHASGDNYSYSFDRLVLPNVHNANDFMRELKRLPNKALQFSGGRA